MSAAPVVFSATGAIQSYLVPTAGTYLIEAAGAQGGAGPSPGLKGARLTGMFFLKRGDILKIVAGAQGALAAPPHHPAGGGGGSSMIWTGSANLPSPIKLMLSARGGKGGKTATAPEANGSPLPGDSERHGPVVDAPAALARDSGIDPSTADALLTQWTRATQSPASSTGSGSAKVDRCGYNAGSFQTSAPDINLGDGYVSITPISVPTTSGSNSPHPTADSARPNDTVKLGPAAEITGNTGGPSTDSLPAAGEGAGAAAPSPTNLPKVIPRLRSWENLLHRRRRP